MTTEEFIIRGYCLFCALTATFAVSLGLWGIICPRSYLTGDALVGAAVLGWSLPVAIISWWHALWWRKEWSK